MAAKSLAIREIAKERQPVVDPRTLTTSAAIMDSMVATEAELQALWAQHDGFAVVGSRPSAKR
jgi:hypothetical protein